MILQSRLEKLRALFEDSGIDAFFSSDKYTVRYFTDKKGDDCSVLVLKDKAYLISDFRYREAMENTEGFIYSEEKPEELIKKEGIARLGFERNRISLEQYLDLKDAAKEAVLCDKLVDNLRMVKDEEEIGRSAVAEKLGCDAFNYILGYIRPGMTERQVALELNNYMLLHGAEELSFDTICVYGAKSSMPHGVPDDSVIGTGNFLTMDFGCVIDGYHSDMTRTIAIGHADDEMIKVYNTVLEAQMNACEKIRAGLTGTEAHRLASDIIDAAGYGEYFGHGLGHGTGLEIHELPRFSPLYDGIIPENTIVSVEPGIYLPGRFGVRIEDLAIVKANGIINLASSAPKELITI